MESSEVAALREGPRSSIWAQNAGDNFAWHRVGLNLVNVPGISMRALR